MKNKTVGFCSMLLVFSMLLCTISLYKKTREQKQDDSYMQEAIYQDSDTLDTIYKEVGRYFKILEFLDNDFPEEPAEEIMYDSNYAQELPESIKADIEYMRENGIYSVQYKLSSLDTNNEEKYIISAFDVTIYGEILINGVNIEEPRIYKNTNTNSICIYGLRKGNIRNTTVEFLKIVYNEDKIYPKEYIIDSDIHILPNELIETRFSIYNMGEAQLYLGKESSEQEGKKLYLYKNKEKLAETEISEKLESYTILAPTMIVDENVYYIFAGVEAQTPWIIAEPAFKDIKGEIVDRIWLNDYKSRNFPILKGEDGLYYSVKPNNMQDFEKYSIANEKQELCKNKEEVDISLQVICLNGMLERIKFIKPAENLSMENYYWMVEFHFGDGLSITTWVDGIDNSVYSYLTDEEVKELETTVYTMEEYWEQVDKIRKTYAQYYSYK